MYCKKCGSQIDENSAFCKKCGEKQPQKVDTTTVYSPPDKDVKKSSPSFFRKVFKTTASKIIAGVLAAAILATGVVIVVVNQNKNRSVLVKPTLDSSSTTTSEVPTTSSSTDTNTTAINIDDYVGRWHINGQGYDSQYDAYERNLSITNLGGDQLSFELFYFRIGAIGCEATLNGNTADFTDEAMEVKGTLTFNENSITVNITSSNFEYMPVETMTFDSRDGGVYEDGQGDDVTNDPLSDSTCPRCGRTLSYGETSCDCTWCDICNAWMLGHGHVEDHLSAVSTSAQSSTNSTSEQSGTGSTQEFVPHEPVVTYIIPLVNEDDNGSIRLEITTAFDSDQNPSDYNAGENLTITVNGTKVNPQTTWRGGYNWLIQINDINLSETKTFTVVLTNQYGLSTTHTVTF